MTPLWELRLRVRAWVIRCLGEPCLLNRKERAARVVEEAVEIAQAEGLSNEYVRRICERTYSRPSGQLTQEVAGLMVALLALSASAGIDIEAVTLDEIERVEKPEVMVKVREKQEEKAKAGTACELTP